MTNITRLTCWVVWSLQQLRYCKRGEKSMRVSRQPDLPTGLGLQDFTARGFLLWTAYTVSRGRIIDRFKTFQPWNKWRLRYYLTLNCSHVLSPMRHEPTRQATTDNDINTPTQPALSSSTGKHFNVSTGHGPGAMASEG